MFRRLEKLVDPFVPYIERTPDRRVWPFIAENLRPFRAVITLSLLLSVVGVALEIWLIGYAGRLVDLLAGTTPNRLWTDHGIELAVAALVVLFGRPLAHVLRESLNDIALRPNAVTLLRWRAHRHVLGHSVGWFQNDFAGRTAARVQEIGNAAAGAAYAVVHTLCYVALYIVGSIWLMASVDLRLIVPMLIWVVLYFALMAYVVPRLRVESERFQAANSAMTGMLVDTYSNIDTIKLFADRAAEDREGRQHFDAARWRFFAIQRLEVTINASMNFLGSLLIVALVGYGVVLWQAGAAPLGLVAAALALSFRITGMAEWLLDAVSSLFNHLGATGEQLKAIAQPVDIADAKDAPELVVTGGAIRLVNVSHHYGKGRGGLDQVSLTIAPGERVGLVGRSGAGKSTLVNLILRFFDLEAGRIEIDGQDIAAVTQESLRRHISMVPQNAALLHRSVGDNIAFGREDISLELIDAAITKAAADGFIPGLVDMEGRRGLDAHVGERGVKLSGGQRQRIALARAILKDAPILVLDEATSALDSEVEAAIQDTLYRVMEGKTVIAIAHRLSTIAHMDRIVVLDHGRVVEEGSHAALLAQNGIYARLWARQSGGFLGAELE